MSCLNLVVVLLTTTSTPVTLNFMKGCKTIFGGYNKGGVHIRCFFHLKQACPTAGEIMMMMMNFLSPPAPKH